MLYDYLHGGFRFNEKPVAVLIDSSEQTFLELEERRKLSLACGVNLCADEDGNEVDETIAYEPTLLPAFCQAVHRALHLT